MMRRLHKLRAEKRRQLVGRIESRDAVSAARAVGYGFEASLSELGRQYDAKAAELPDEYLGELAAISGEQRRPKTVGGARESIANSGFPNF